jgi:acyl-CoA thioesterase FadM
VSGKERPYFAARMVPRWADVDNLGACYTARLFEWSHEAFEDLLVAAGDRLDKAFDEEGWGMPLVHAEASIVEPIRWADELEVRLYVARIGRRSLGLEFDFVDAGGTVRATTRLVHAFAPLDGLGKAIPFPERLRGILERMGLLKTGA